jgi:hypothetical protein
VAHTEIFGFRTYIILPPSKRHGSETIGGLLACCYPCSRYVLLETPADYFLSHDYSCPLRLSSEIAVPCKQHRIRRCIRCGENCYPIDGARSILLGRYLGFSYSLQLAYGQTLPSHTSLQTNTCAFSLNQKTTTLVDVPGHPRIRDQFREHLATAKAIVFVVDTSSVSRIGPIVAEYVCCHTAYVSEPLMIHL